MKRIGLDVDGVLAEFNTPFRELLGEQTGKVLPPIEACCYPTEWAWHRAAGITAEEEAAAWRTITESRRWWRDLPPLEGASLLRDLNQAVGEVEVYFITARPGRLAQYQTAAWLEQQHFMLPSVLIAPTADDKASVVKGLGLHGFLDDRPENVRAVVQQSPMTAGFLLDQPWNRDADDLERVESVEEFLHHMGINLGQLT